MNIDQRVTQMLNASPHQRRALMLKAVEDPGMARALLVAAQQGRDIEAAAYDGPAMTESNSHPPHPGPYSKYQYAPSRLISTKDVGFIPPGEERSVKVDFTSNAGRILGWKGVSIEETSGGLSLSTQAGMLVSMTFNIKEPIITDGDDPAESSFAELFPLDQSFTPLERDVDTRTILLVKFTNSHPTFTLKPRLTFGIYSDPYGS